MLLISYGPKFYTQRLKIVPPFVMVFKPLRLKVTRPPKTTRVAEIPMMIRPILYAMIKLVHDCKIFWSKRKENRNRNRRSITV